MAKKFDPAKKLKKWQQNTNNGQAAYVDGINSVTENPMQKAAQKGDTAKQRYAQAIDNGSWAQALNGTPMSTWQQNSTQIGAPRIPDGVKKGTPKMSAYLSKSAPVYAANVAAIDAMPNATDADRRARMLANLDMMKAMKGIAKR